MFLYFSYCDGGHGIIKQETRKNSADLSRECCGLAIVQYWDKTQCLVLSASPFCSNIVFKNAERYCGVFTVKLRGPTAAPPQTENWFLVWKIECNILCNVCFPICTLSFYILSCCLCQ